MKSGDASGPSRVRSNSISSPRKLDNLPEAKIGKGGRPRAKSLGADAMKPSGKRLNQRLSMHKGTEETSPRELAGASDTPKKEAALPKQPPRPSMILNSADVDKAVADMSAAELGEALQETENLLEDKAYIQKHYDIAAMFRSKPAKNNAFDELNLETRLKAKSLGKQLSSAKTDAEISSTKNKVVTFLKELGNILKNLGDFIKTKNALKAINKELSNIGKNDTLGQELLNERNNIQNTLNNIKAGKAPVMGQVQAHIVKIEIIKLEHDEDAQDNIALEQKKPFEAIQLENYRKAMLEFEDTPQKTEAFNAAATAALEAAFSRVDIDTSKKAIESAKQALDIMRGVTKSD